MKPEYRWAIKFGRGFGNGNVGTMSRDVYMTRAEARSVSRFPGDRIIRVRVVEIRSKGKKR